MEVTIFASAVQSSTYRLRADIFQHWFFSAWTHNLSLGKNNKSNNQVLFSPLIFAACSLADKEKVGRLFSLRVSCVLVLLITHTESQQACAHVCACVCTSVHLVVSCSVCTDHTDHNQLPQSQASGSPGTFTQAKNRQKKGKPPQSHFPLTEKFSHRKVLITFYVTQRRWHKRQRHETRGKALRPGPETNRILRKDYLKKMWVLMSPHQVHLLYIIIYIFTYLVFWSQSLVDN